MISDHVYQTLPKDEFNYSRSITARCLSNFLLNVFVQNKLCFKPWYKSLSLTKILKIYHQFFYRRTLFLGQHFTFKITVIHIYQQDLAVIYNLGIFIDGMFFNNSRNINVEITFQMNFSFEDTIPRILCSDSDVASVV